MRRGLVTEPELLWVLDSLGGQALSREVSEKVPIDQNAVYIRLRGLKKKDHLDYDEEGGKYKWYLTERGQDALSDTDLPPADETDFQDHFAGRTMTLRPNLILETVARAKDEWVSTSVLFDDIDFAKSTVRQHLYNLNDNGFVDKDDYYNANRWRVTEAGYERLAGAEKTLDPHNEDTYIWKVADKTDV